MNKTSKTEFKHAVSKKHEILSLCRRINERSKKEFLKSVSQTKCNSRVKLTATLTY